MKRISSILLAAGGAIALTIACQSGGTAPEGQTSPEANPEAMADDPTTCADGDPTSGLELWREEGDDSAVPVDPVEPAAVAAAEPVVHQPVAAPPIAQSGPITVADNGESQRRYLTQMRPVDTGGGVFFRTASDRESARIESLEARAKLRAFEGAPPVMSHSANFSARSKTCLDCHDQGMTIGERVAHPMSHEPLINCTQCHVEEEATRAGEELLERENTFEGIRYTRRGEASITGAPPVMPHSTQMRTRCLSCHGEFGYPGLKTTHPKRVNCVSCHIEVTNY